MKSARLALPMLALGLALACGCAPELVYRPAVLGATGGPAVRYPIPPETPRGDVYVTSFGFSDLEVGPGGQRASLLHARLAVGNGSQIPWAIDGRQQEVLIEGQPPLVPAFLNSDAGPGPFYSVPPGQSRVFDLYYAVPAPMDRIEALPSFALSWRVLAGAEAVAQRTPFQRVPEEGGAYGPYPPYVTVGLGFGFGWWYGPFYPYHYPPVIRGYYYPPARARTSGSWRGAPPGTSRGWRGSPPAGGGGWRGSPPRGGGGGWRGSPRV